MHPPDPSLLGILYGASEIWLGFTRRAGARTASRDRKSLLLLWVVIFASVFFAISAAYSWPWARMSTSYRYVVRWIGLFIFVAGLALRWYAIGYLGKFFTVNVAIHSDHRLIESGPYRHIRHPSYTGALIAFIGLGLSFGNWISLAIFTIPILIAFLVRIQIEERALAEAIGQPYREYQKRTRRLVPFVY